MNDITSVKRSATILLLSLMVTTQTPAGQLFKIPSLVKHYEKHQKQSEIDFIDFLVQHYASQQKDLNSPEHDQLPFKSLSVQQTGIAILTSSPVLPATIERAVCNKNVDFSSNCIPDMRARGIFHPPKR